jgi:hypothetical protein
MPADLPAYVELHCLSCFSFLRGASHPDELVARAQAQGYAALALTDECSLAGSVRAHVAAKEAGLKLIVGSEFTLVDGTKLVLLAQNRAGYGNLSALITLGRRRAEKGAYRLTRGDLESLIPCACGSRRKMAIPPPGAGCPSAFPAAAGSASASSTARTMHSALPASLHWRKRAACRLWQRVTCTCTRAGGGRCRTC